MSDIQDIAKAIAQATANNTKNTTSTTNATVKRIEDGVAYVQFDGAETETPVQLTISASTGDTVKVTVSNGKAWIVGNTTAPPTDDSAAVQLFNELKAEKITADRIDVSDLFAQKIECKGTITGATLKGGTIEGTTVKAGTIDGTDINGATITGSSGEFTQDFTVCIPATVDKKSKYIVFTNDSSGVAIGLSNSNTITKDSIESGMYLLYTGAGIYPYIIGDVVEIDAKSDIYLNGATSITGGATIQGMLVTTDDIMMNGESLSEWTKDTGWRYPTIASSFTATNNTPRARRIGKTVVFTGAVNPSKKLSGSSDKVTICTLGDNYRPSNQINILCQGSGQNKWMLTIETTGTVSFSRYGTTAAYVDANTSTWLPFHTSWFVD